MVLVSDKLSAHLLILSPSAAWVDAGKRLRDCRPLDASTKPGRLKLSGSLTDHQNTCCFCRRWWKGCLDQTGRSQSCIHLVLDEIKRWRDWSKEKRRNNCIVMYYNYIHQEKKRKRRNNWIQLHTSKLQLHTIAWPRNLQWVEVHKKS